MIDPVFIAACEGRLKDLKVIFDNLQQWEVSKLLLDNLVFSLPHTSGLFGQGQFQLLTPLIVSCWYGHQEAVHTSLKCLAARVVRKYDMKLDSLSLTLKDFVLNH